ncbi:MAG: ATP-grasp domain-containing protein [Gammaproteobacteria bacterium]|nr:ATP-grasp domain-containing protein [Gammaproteobacteria bacterium]
MHNHPILVLGGGQLGLMMAEAAIHLGVVVDRLDTANDKLMPGTSNLRVDTTLDFLVDRYAVITAEMEHLPDSGLVNGLRLSERWMNGSAFDILPGRNQQKRLLDEIGVHNAPWKMLHAQDDMLSAHDSLGETLVVKTTRGGYDGKGQWVVSRGDDQDIPASAFGELIAEQKVSFSREVSLVGARSEDGQTLFYPLAENHHHNGILRFSIAPAMGVGKLGDSANFANLANLQSEAERMLTKIMTKLNYVGVMAMECFEVDGELMVNELALRVHNSGHWSQTGSCVSQFNLHIRALSGVRFPQEPVYQPTLMINLIGCEYHPRWHQIDGVHCYWYGKERRAHRKLGHINMTGSTSFEIQQKADALRPLLDAEHQSMLDKALALINSH